MSNSVKRFWCLFFGIVTGTVVAKIYEIWAMLYQLYGRDYSSEPRSFRPLWTFIKDSPIMARLIIISIFICIAILFSNCLINKSDHEIETFNDDNQIDSNKN